MKENSSSSLDEDSVPTVTTTTESTTQQQIDDNIISTTTIAKVVADAATVPQITINCSENNNSSSSSGSSNCCNSSNASTPNSTCSGRVDGGSLNRSIKHVSFTVESSSSAKDSPKNNDNHHTKIKNTTLDICENGCHDDGGDISPSSIVLSDTIIHAPNNAIKPLENRIAHSKELWRVKIGETPSPIPEGIEECKSNELHKNHHHKIFQLDGFHSSSSIDVDGCSTSTTTKKSRRKSIFSVFHKEQNAEHTDEEPVVFFDLEKPTKKKAKKSKKSIVGSIYKISILVLLFCALSSIVVFGISMDNSNSDQIGFFTSGSPATVVWTSVFHMSFTLIFVFDLFGPLFLLRWYKRIVSFIEKKGLTKSNFTHQINIDGYSGSLIVRVFWGTIIFITSLINWVCYGLYSENRESLSGWISLFFILSPLSYFFISYQQFKTFRKNNATIFELKEEKLIEEDSLFRTKICCRFAILAKMATYMLMAVVCAFFILFTIQSVSISREEYKVPGKLYTIKTPSSQPMKIHMYCEGDEESEDAILLDSDIGVASPYAYMKNLISLLANNGMRACVMERGGYGFSDSGPFPRDLTNTSMNEMLALVKESSFRIPFILISHSTASFTARTMMEYHRKLMRGVILLHPSHEKQETYLLHGVYNLTDNQITRILNEKRYIANTIRFATPIGFTRFFSDYFYQKLPFTLGTIHERYHMNGWKTYFGTFPNSTVVQLLTKYNQHTININKFNNAVWAELDDMENSTQNIISTRAKREQFHSANDTYILPVTILTSGKLLNGSCADNYLSNESTVCNDFLKYQRERANATLSMHRDLAEYYNSTKLVWNIVNADFDIAVTSPNVVLDETLRMLKQTYK